MNKRGGKLYDTHVLSDLSSAEFKIQPRDFLKKLTTFFKNHILLGTKIFRHCILGTPLVRIFEDWWFVTLLT